MHTSFEGRESDSPYIEAVWRGQAGREYAPVCPASSHWHLLFFKQHGKTRVSVQWPLTRATPVAQPEGTEWLGVTFSLGVFLPFFSIKSFLDEQTVLPLTAGTSFYLDGSSWSIPDYENAETFIARLARHNMLISDPVVKAVLAHQPVKISARTVRCRFVLATGLTYKTIAQIERAKQTAAMIEQSTSLIDSAYQAGSADQSHMTRALKHFIGYTPAVSTRAGNEEIQR